MKKIFFAVISLVIFQVHAQQPQKQDEVSTPQLVFSKASSSSGSSGSALTENVLPKNSPFQLGENIEGIIQNSINKTTGKVVFSIPIATVNANAIAHGVSFIYNGAAAFEEAQNTNKSNPTSVLGVGFSMSIPKIVSDYKNTAAIDDDTYYLQDGNNTRLICTNRTDTYLEFEPEQYAPWKIKYIIGHYEIIEVFPGNWQNVFFKDDYWEVIKEDGTIYEFGTKGGTDCKMQVSTWGNWIGDSNQRPTGAITTEWYIYKIKDQWDNYLRFTYEKTNGKQTSIQPNYFHTEAMYLKEIKSSDNSKVTFQYGNKVFYEYFEPHTEQVEPDAFQEKYEKKYLQDIKTYNPENGLVFTYKLEYNVLDYNDLTQPYRGKRYLKKITQENKDGISLPPQEFTWYTSGDFKGGIDKITYPTGGEVTYKYKTQTLFYNGANRFSNAVSNLSDYYLKASYNGGNYVLDLYRSKNTVFQGKYRYQVVRHFWNGTQWDSHALVLPDLLPWEICRNQGGGCLNVYLDGFKVVHGPDYYGFLSIDRTFQSARIHLFHLNKDGKTWNYFTEYISSVESRNAEPYNEDPAFLNGNNFVAIGTIRTGELRTYVWNGTTWEKKYLDQIEPAYGHFYYSARNNFILALNEDGGPDMSNGVGYADNYYIHYLDAENTWQYKSWTTTALANMNTVEGASNFFPSNAMTGYIADDNPEYFLRWDTNYNLTNVDNFIGAYADFLPMYNSSTGLFTIDDSYTNQPFRDYLYTTARFNGISWAQHLNYTYASDVKSVANGRDMLLYQVPVYANFSTIQNLKISLFNPNNNTWMIDNFISPTVSGHNFSNKTSLLNEFLFTYDNIYRRRENPFSTFAGSHALYSPIPFNVGFSNTNGLNYAYLTSLSGADHFNPNFFSGSFTSRLYFVNGKTDGISSKNIDNKFGMKGMKEFGGSFQFLNGNSLYLRNQGTFSGSTNTFTTYLYRIIDDKIDENITDVVVENINLDNKQDPFRIFDFAFSNYNITPDGSIYYGRASTKNKGYGSGNIGEVVEFYHNGSGDIRRTGTPTRTEVRDASNNLKSETILTTDLFSKTQYNSSNVPVERSYYLRNTRKVNNVLLSNGTVSTTEDYEYNPFGLLNKTTITYGGSQDKVETSTKYAYELFSFLTSKNFMNQPAKIVERRNNEIIGTSETKWKQENNRVYPYQTLAGVQATKVLTDVSRINSYGLIEEESNGKGIYQVALYGHNYRYPVAVINNTRYTDVIAQLDVSYSALQNLSNSSLETELMKLYTRLPLAGISLSFYDNRGNLTSMIDSRKEKVTYTYDNFNRLITTKDAQGNKLSETKYNYKQ